MSYNTNRIHESYQLFFKAAMENEDIELLAESAYKLLGHPIVINDAFSCNILQYPNEPIGDPDFDRMLDTKIAEFKQHSTFWRNYVLQVREYPIYIQDGSLSKTPQFFSVLKKGTVVIGFTSFLNPDPEHLDEEREIIRIFNVAATHLIDEMGHKIDSKGTWNYNTFKQILADPGAVDNLLQKAKNFSVAYPPAYAILLVQPNEELKNDPAIYKYMDSLCIQLRRRFTNYLCLRKEDKLLLFGSDLKTEKFSPKCGKMLHYLEKLPVLVSVSTAFQNLEESRGYLLQAKLTMQTGRQLEKMNNHTENPYRAENYIPLQVYTGFANTYETDPFTHPILRDIMAYDKENNTEYLNTLHMYLFCMMDKKRATEMLHIHYNTLTYRLKKLESKFHVDFDNFFQLNNIVGSFGILITNGSYNPIMLWNKNPDIINE